MKHSPEIRYYSSFSDDFTQSADQQCTVPEGYQWIRRDRRSVFLSKLTYGLALVFSSVYCRLFLHVRIKGAERFRNVKDTGAFIYGNHTLPVGDVFDPALACFPRRIYTVVSPANLGIPVIGRILPYLGALPLTDSIQGVKKLTQAIEERIGQNCFVVIYPEAHVWEYCTEIRPFSESSFKFPVRLDKPSFVLTSTFQKRRFGKKPKVTIFVDGPFYPKKDGSVKVRAQELCQRVSSCMKKRSESSDYQYIEYRHISQKIQSEK